MQVLFDVAVGFFCCCCMFPFSQSGKLTDMHSGRNETLAGVKKRGVQVKRDSNSGNRTENHRLKGLNAAPLHSQRHLADWLAHLHIGS